MSVSIQADVSGTSGTVKVNGNTAFTFDNAGVLNATTIQHNGVATERISLGTAVATTSGTAVDFTGIPSWAKKITATLNGVSLTSTDGAAFQLGTASGVTTTGYNSISAYIPNGASPATATNAAYICHFGAVAATLVYGTAQFTLHSGNTWVATLSVYRANDAGLQTSAGAVTLSGTLTRIRFLTAGSSFDAGSVNILIEG